MANEIKIRVQLDPSCREPEVIIRAKEKTALIEEITAAIESCARRDEKQIPAYRDGALTLLNQREIVRVYTENKRLIVRTAQGGFEAKNTLQNVEALLNPDMFLRISRFELVNLNKIQSFDFNVSGTIKVNFEDGSSTWAARRYVRAIEQRLNPTENAKEAQA